MIIKTIQWNIGGGKIRYPMASAEGIYNIDGMAHIVGVLRKFDPDIITLQETHADENCSSTEIIAKEIGFPYSMNDVYDKSHIEYGQGLGQAIISRFPISGHNFKLFSNPHFEAPGPNGGIWVSHDKGVSRWNVNFRKEKTIEVATLHLIPFRIFGINPLEEKFEGLRKNIAELASPVNNSFLLQGDFNFDETSLEKFLPDLLNQHVSEVLLDKSTTPEHRKLDHVLYRGLKHVCSKVITDVLTDHFPVYSEFEI